MTRSAVAQGSVNATRDTLDADYFAADGFRVVQLTPAAVVEDGAKRTQDGAAVVEQTREAFLSIGQAVEEINTRIE